MAKEATVFDLLSKWVAARGETDAAIEQYDAAALAAREEFVAAQSAAVVAAEEAVKAHKDFGLIAGMIAPTPAKPSRKVEASEAVYGLFDKDGNAVENEDGSPVVYSRKVTTVAPSLRASIGADLTGYSVRHLVTQEVLSDTLTYRKDREPAATAAA